MKDIRMEYWTICLKAIVLFYVVSLSNISEASICPRLILFILFYVSTNISFYLSKNIMRLLLIILSMAGIIVSYYVVSPMLILLISINIYEFASIIVKKHLIRMIFMLAPLIMLPFELMIPYLFIAAFSFVYFTMLGTYSNKLQTYKNTLDEMRRDLHRLTVRLDENNEYVRQFEYSIKLEERNRISQQIHDQIGHSMTGALFQMEAAKRLIDGEREKSKELLQNAIQILKDGIEHIRLVLKHVKPLTEQLGINRMKLLIDEFSANHSVKTVFTYAGNLDSIAPIHWKIIQENTVEALTNTMKYANATVVTIHIEVLNTLIKCVISDNGNGASKVIKGLGIIGMEERAAMVNGTVIVDGSQGFSVTTLIPYDTPMKKLI